MSRMAGQTLSEIRALLERAGLTPRKRFGQNFLIDLNLMRKLVASADAMAADVVLEVGPGTGSLTEILLQERGARVVAAEIDRGLAALLRERFADQPRFTLIEGDALASKHVIHPNVLDKLSETPPDTGGTRKLIANLPYDIATSLILNLLLLDHPRVELLACTIQKEVAERFVAAARDEAYGPVSVVAQSLAKTELIATLPPSAFWPRPQVDSAMLLIRRLPSTAVEVDAPREFAAFVQAAFQQRRKKIARLVASLEPSEADAVFAKAGVTADRRPEELSPAEWRRFYQVLSQAIRPR